MADVLRVPRQAAAEPLGDLFGAGTGGAGRGILAAGGEGEQRGDAQGAGQPEEEHDL
ncbi:hypothetical protein [Nonomuraea sp. NPDC049709]|uniref:hypothetical protein n=1 Tax=Nonomuraea sp. NPDC049709 TaxID=3154736 RepID=UPI0034323108